MDFDLPLDTLCSSIKYINPETKKAIPVPPMQFDPLNEGKSDSLMLGHWLTQVRQVQWDNLQHFASDNGHTNGVEETDGDIDADVLADSESASGGVREGIGSESEESDSDYEEENLDDDDERKEWWVDRVVCHRLKKQKNEDGDSQEMEYLLLFEASPISEWVGVNRINSGCTHLIKQYWDSLNQTQFDQEVTTSNVLSLWDSSMAKTDISRFESLLDKVEIEKKLQSVKEVVSVVANIPASWKTATLTTILEGWLEHNSCEAIHQWFLSLLSDTDSVSRELAGLYQIMEVAQALPATAGENVLVKLAEQISRWRLKAQKSNGGIGAAAAAAYLLEASFENFYQLSFLSRAAHRPPDALCNGTVPSV
ncbi:hypothetical protein DFP72DRAFT_1066441 [Ephemerocybe angulata]|uniref:Uncharacterized protein n=1 Tax=Ephemerocybe angulata TaxID=980116 RepID=A0A8H6M9Z9_9AGAR|nr:hypothetical protein DFP72DRAFT_1066441 [Tulosesus angulatus]